MEPTIRLQALDGRWEVAGRDRYPGVVPESTSVQSDPGGYAVASFQLRRPDLWIPSPDLSAWTPCEIDEGEARLFEGRVQETPIGAGEGVITVAGRGWQYHKDDDAIRPMHLQTDLGIFQDTRAVPGYPASTYLQAGRVEAGGGQITFGWEKGFAVPIASAVGVMVDFGYGLERDAYPTAVVVEFDTTNPVADFSFYCRGHSVVDWSTVGGVSDYFIASMSAGVQHRSNYITVRRRYLHLFLYNPAATAALAADTLIRIRRIWLAKDRDSMGSAGLPLVRSSDVIRHAIARAAPKLQLPPFDTPNLWRDEVIAAKPKGWWRPGFADASNQGTQTLPDASDDLITAAGVPTAIAGPLEDGQTTQAGALDGNDAYQVGGID